MILMYLTLREKPEGDPLWLLLEFFFRPGPEDR